MKVVKIGSALWCRPIVPYGVGPHCPMVLAHKLEKVANEDCKSIGSAQWCRPIVPYGVGP